MKLFDYIIDYIIKNLEYLKQTFDFFKKNIFGFDFLYLVFAEKVLL